MDLTKQPPHRPTNLSIAGLVGVLSYDRSRAANDLSVDQWSKLDHQKR